MLWINKTSDVTLFHFTSLAHHVTNHYLNYFSNSSMTLFVIAKNLIIFPGIVKGKTEDSRLNPAIL